MSTTKTCLITGSSRGFGRELAKGVLASGDQAVATAGRPEQLDDLVRQYDNLVRRAPLDVTDPVAASAAAQAAIDAFGALDDVVNNAGYAVRPRRHARPKPRCGPTSAGAPTSR